MDKDKLKKLPKWAQNEFMKLENDKKFYKKKFSELSGDKETNVFMFCIDNTIPLFKNATIRFVNKEAFFDVSIIDDSLRIYASNAINILPRAANSCHIRQEDWNEIIYIVYLICMAWIFIVLGI